MKACNLVLFLAAAAAGGAEGRLVGTSRESEANPEDSDGDDYCGALCDDVFAGSSCARRTSVPYGSSDCFCNCIAEDGGFRTVATATRETAEAQIMDLSEFGSEYIERWFEEHGDAKTELDFQELVDTVWSIINAEHFFMYGNDQGDRSLSLENPNDPTPTDAFFPNPDALVPCTTDPSCQLVSKSLGPYIPPGTAESFAIPGTCQASARDWLRTGEGVPEFTGERIRQRYAMTVFFCEQDGGEWLENSEWLSDLHECDWYNNIGLDPCDQLDIIGINGNE